MSDQRDAGLGHRFRGLCRFPLGDAAKAEAVTDCHLAGEAQRLGAGTNLLYIEEAHLARLVQVDVEANAMPSAMAKIPSSCPLGSRSISSGSMPPTRSAPLRMPRRAGREHPDSASPRSAGTQRSAPSPGHDSARGRQAPPAFEIDVDMSAQVASCPRDAFRDQLPARSSVDNGKCGRIFLSVSIRLIRVGPAA